MIGPLSFIGRVDCLSMASLMNEDPQSQPTSPLASEALRALFVAPYGVGPGHLSARRLERFQRWLAVDQWNVSALADGRDALSDSCRRVEVVDPAFASRGAILSDQNDVARLSKYARFAARRCLVPDSKIIWGTRACISPLVYKAAAASQVIVSTSPPESAHLLGAWISKVVSVPHLIDLRDGWLDEPLRGELKARSVRRSIERVMESRVLSRAEAITVTSPEWKRALVERYPNLEAKVHVIPNVVPGRLVSKTPSVSVPPIPRLIYAGRLGASHGARDARFILGPLEIEAQNAGRPFEVVFMGSFSREEGLQLQAFGGRIAARGWRIRVLAAGTYEQALSEISRSDGMLLLSASKSAIPSKLFDYVATRKPILALCARNSATWNACAALEQAWLVDPFSSVCPVGFCKLVLAGRMGNVPAWMTEATVAAHFRRVVSSIVKVLPDAPKRFS